MLPSEILQETQKESSYGGFSWFSWTFGSLSALTGVFASLNSFGLIWIIEQEKEVSKQEQPIVKE